MQLAVSPVPDIAPASRSNGPDGSADASHDASSHDFEKALSAAHTDRTEQRSSAPRAASSDKPKEHEHDDKDDSAAVPTAVQTPAIIGTPPASQQPQVSPSQDAAKQTNSMDGVAAAAPQSQGLKQAAAGNVGLISLPTQAEVSGVLPVGVQGTPTNAPAIGNRPGVATPVASVAPVAAGVAVPPVASADPTPVVPSALPAAAAADTRPAPAATSASSGLVSGLAATGAEASPVLTGVKLAVRGSTAGAAATFPRASVDSTPVDKGNAANPNTSLTTAAASNKPLSALSLIRSTFAQVSVSAAATAQPTVGIGPRGKSIPASLQDVLQAGQLSQPQVTGEALPAGTKSPSPVAISDPLNAFNPNVHLVAASTSRVPATSGDAGLKNSSAIPDNLLGNAQSPGVVQAKPFGLDDGLKDTAKKNDDIVVPGQAQASTAVFSGAPAAKAEAMKPVDQDAMVARVGQAIKQMSTNASNKSSSVSIHLNPVEWGKLNITVGLDGAQAGAGTALRAHIVAESEAVKTALQQHISELKGHLQADGLRVESITVTVQASASSSDAGTDSHRQDTGGGSTPNPQQQSSFSGFGGGTFSQSFAGADHGSSSGQGQGYSEAWAVDEQDAMASAAAGSRYQTGQVDLRA